jgi:hypothetical protein
VLFLGGAIFTMATGDGQYPFSTDSPGSPSMLIPWSSQILARLYLVTIFQYVETLPDQLARETIRKRIDWKYALHVPLNYPGLGQRLFVNSGIGCCSHSLVNKAFKGFCPGFRR